MMLTKTIDNLCIATRYGVWVLAVIGIIASVILTFVNVTLGIPSAVLCVGALLLALAIALALFPKQLVKGTLLEKRFIIAPVVCILAIAIVGIVYFTNSGFPTLNLIFI